MIPEQLKFLRWPFDEWKRRRFWALYDDAYEQIMGHAALHEEWLKSELASSPEKLFSIGPGRGELELALCRHYDCAMGYAETFPRYRRAVEERFREAGLAERIVERHAGSYKGFTPGNSYGLILSIHSWYSFGYDAELLRRTLGMLSPGGSFVLTVTAADDFFFCNAVKQRTFSAEELSAWAQDHGFDHDFHTLRLPIAGDELVRGDKLTEQARGAVGFLRGRFWQQLPRQEQREIQKRFVRAVQHDGVERIYGLLQFRNKGQAG